MPPDELEAERPLAAAVQPEGGALVRGVRRARRGAAGPAHLAAVRAEHLQGGYSAELARSQEPHLAVVEHDPESEGQEAGAERGAAVDRAVGDGGGGRGVRRQRHPPPAPPGGSLGNYTAPGS